jgi:membrane associated rhomboid family serine protease
VKQPSEPILNVPPIVVATIAALVLVHAGRALLLSDQEDTEFLLQFAFIPARYVGPLVGRFPGGFGADIWTFVTYALIHANLIHLGANIVWLLPFGTAVARRFGPARFVVLLAVTAAAAALAQLLIFVASGVDVELIGASGAISGLMGAAIRFVFQSDGPLSRWGMRDAQGYDVPAAPLLVSLRNPRVLIFLLVWFATNLLFGVLGVGALSGSGAEEAIAWQAHIGGFLAGLLLFPLFDPATQHAGSR